MLQKPLCTSARLREARACNELSGLSLPQSLEQQLVEDRACSTFDPDCTGITPSRRHCSKHACSSSLLFQQRRFSASLGTATSGASSAPRPNKAHQPHPNNTPQNDDKNDPKRRLSLEDSPGQVKLGPRSLQPIASQGSILPSARPLSTLAP